MDILDPKYIILTGQEKMMVSVLFDMISEILPHRIDVVYQRDHHEGHYSTTPYKYHPSLGMKLVGNNFIDLGQGLLNTLDGISMKNCELSKSDHIDTEYVD